MDKNIKLKLLIALMLPITNLMAQPAVDGFMKGKGSMDVALGGTYETFSQYYSKLNSKVPVSRTSIAASVFAAAGITNWLDAQVNIPYVYTSGDLSGMQDFSGYLKLKMLDYSFENGNNIKFIAVGGYGLPMTDYFTESINSIGQQATFYEGRGVLQMMWTSGFFAMAQAGYTQREDPVPSGYPAAVKIGWAKAKYYLDIWYDQQWTTEGNDYQDYRDEVRDNGSSDISFRTFGVSYGKLGVTYYKPFWKRSGMAFGASYVLWGRNVGETVGVSVAYVQRINLFK